MSRMTNAMQTSYSFLEDRFLAGVVPYPDARTNTAKAAEQLSYGTGVVVDTAGEPVVVKKPTADTEQFFGVVMFGKKTANENSLSFYKTGDEMAIVTHGSVAVPVTVAIKKSEKAYLIASGPDAGKFTNVAASNIDVNGIFDSNDNKNVALVTLNGKA